MTPCCWFCLWLGSHVSGQCTQYYDWLGGNLATKQTKLNCVVTMHEQVGWAGIGCDCWYHTWGDFLMTLRGPVPRSLGLPIAAAIVQPPAPIPPGVPLCMTCWQWSRWCFYPGKKFDVMDSFLLDPLGWLEVGAPHQGDQWLMVHEVGLSVFVKECWSWWQVWGKKMCMICYSKGMHICLCSFLIPLTFTWKGQWGGSDLVACCYAPKWFVP